MRYSPKTQRRERTLLQLDIVPFSSPILVTGEIMVCRIDNATQSSVPIQTISKALVKRQGEQHRGGPSVFSMQIFAELPTTQGFALAIL
jgi:hypothetical protein